MPSLESHLNSVNFSTQLSVVKNLIYAAQTKTTFWGSRIVEVNGFTGSVYLDDVGRKIVEAGEQRRNADDLTPAERIAGVEIVTKIKEFYRITDAQIQNSNLLTQFLNWAREFSFIPYTTRFYIEETAEADFRAFSGARFLQQFGGSFDEMHNHPAFNGCFGHPLRVLAREDRIRA